MRPVVALAAVLLVLLAAGCAPGANPLANHPGPGGETAGFLLGLWHGNIVWFSFLWSLFNPSVSVYEVHNNGWPYNLGFLLGAGGVLGGGVKVALGGDRRQ